MTLTVTASIVAFTIVILLLVALLLYAQKMLVQMAQDRE